MQEANKHKEYGKLESVTDKYISLEELFVQQGELHSDGTREPATETVPRKEWKNNQKIAEAIAHNPRLNRYGNRARIGAIKYSDPTEAGVQELISRADKNAEVAWLVKVRDENNQPSVFLPYFMIYFGPEPK